MRGHVRKRGSKWVVIYDEGRDANGRRIQRWQSGFKTRRDAERGLTEILGRLEQGSYAQPSNKTVSEFLAAWLEARLANRANTSELQKQRNPRSAGVSLSCGARTRTLTT